MRSAQALAATMNTNGIIAAVRLRRKSSLHTCARAVRPITQSGQARATWAELLAASEARAPTTDHATDLPRVSSSRRSAPAATDAISLGLRGHAMVSAPATEREQASCRQVVTDRRRAGRTGAQSSPEAAGTGRASALVMSRVERLISKFALRGLSEALRTELAEEPDVHICTVFPYAGDRMRSSRAQPVLPVPAHARSMRRCGSTRTAPWHGRRSRWPDAKEPGGPECSIR
jgi:hypothetical protein